MPRIVTVVLIVAATVFGDWAFTQSPTSPVQNNRSAQVAQPGRSNNVVPSSAARQSSAVVQSSAAGQRLDTRERTGSRQSDPSPVAAVTNSSAQLRAENCMVKTIQNIRVPAGAEGRITELMTMEGANVNAGDVLALVDDTQAQLALQLRKAEERETELNALNTVNYRDAVNSEKSAAAEAEAYKELRREGATPYWEMEKKILEAVRAQLRIELAELQQNIAKIQYVAKRTERELAEHELTRHQVIAPFAGFVENRIAQLGEWVQPGSPILQLVQLDKLRVEGDIDAMRYPGQIARGTPVKVLIYASTQRADSATSDVVEIDGRIGFVSSEIDLRHRNRIWVEIDNRQVGEEWLFKPGMEADILVDPAGTVN